MIAVTGQGWDLAADRARLDAVRCHLGAQLAAYRKAAGLSQPDLGEALGKTRSMVSKIEHGRRGIPTKQWELTDKVCQAQGALLAAHAELAQAEQEYRDRCRAQRRAAQRAQAQADLHALTTCPGPQPEPPLRASGQEAGPAPALVSGELAEELRRVVTKLARLLPRRQAIQLASWALGAVGLTGLDIDEYTRVAQAVQAPHRVDGQVIQNLAAMLAHCKRLEDKLGPTEVLDTAVAQHGMVRRMLEGGCPERFRRPLLAVHSNMASTIGGYLVDMGDHGAAQRYFQKARKAGHDARSTPCAAYAAINMSMSGFLCGETHTALDAAAAARSLTARTDDAQLKTLAEQMAAAAYALDGQHGPCMAACARAQQFLAGGNESTSDSLAYWVHDGTLGSQLSLFLVALDRPRQAVEAARKALARHDRSYVGRYAHCQARLGNALVLSREIDEAARVLAEAATLASQSPSPRLLDEIRTARTRMQPWHTTPAVTTLDAQLQEYGLAPR